MSVSRPPLEMYHWRLVTISSGRSPRFIELHWVFEWSRLADEFLRFGQHLNNFALSLLDVEARYFCVGVSVYTCWCFVDDAAVTANDGVWAVAVRATR